MIKKILIGTLGLVILLSAAAYIYYRVAIYKPLPISKKDRAAIKLMPLPAALQLGKGTLDISAGVHIVYGNAVNEKIEQSVRRFLDRVGKKIGSEAQNDSGVKLNVHCLGEASADIQQALENETYSLDVNRKEIVLEAPSPYGIIRGLETLFQLIAEKDGKMILPEGSITDEPRYSWRGLMVDVSRHWVPKDVILRILDAMAVVKMNVFHWSLTNDQGFRVESKVFPKLHEIGSNGQYYTQEEIREVIQFAAERGIRVVPEFNLPGHSKSWQIAYPELSSVSHALTFGRQEGEGLFHAPIDPTKEEVYNFIDRFIGEMAALFPDPYFHIGGDEVAPNYWQENMDIQQFMTEHDLKDVSALQTYFNKRMYRILKKHHKRMLGWNEIFHPGISKDVVIQAWTSHKSLFEAVQNGGAGILSSGLYLDHILTAEEYYKVDPEILVGAIDLEPDTANWKMFDMTMNFGGTERVSQLVIFDRDPDDVFGFFALFDDRLAFKNGSITNNILNCKLNGPVGEMNFKTEFLGDSTSGKMSLGLLNFNIKGRRSGGSDRPGTTMPKIEVMKPLTEAERSGILGGEACQWAEFVDGENIESRIWPRAAAIAEKLWSPQTLTTETGDMYRRLHLLSDQLTQQGSTHDTQYAGKLRKMVPTAGFEYLTTLTDILQEVRYHGRMAALIETPDLYLPDFPLDRIVDAVRPESWPARSFNQLVETYIAEPSDTSVEETILAQLEAWKTNHTQLEPYIKESEKLADIERISGALSTVAEAAMLALSHQTQPEEQTLELLDFLEEGEHGLVVAIAPGLRKIFTNVVSNYHE